MHYGRSIKDGAPGVGTGNGRKIFVSGSSKTQTEDSPYYRKELPKQIKDQLQKHINKNDKFLIGDAPGIDTQVQKYLKNKKYKNVVVYTTGKTPRYKADSKWKTKAVDTKGYEKDSKEYLKQKDIAMTNDADEGLAIILENGGASATRNNVKRLYDQHKDAKVFMLTSSNNDDWVNASEEILEKMKDVHISHSDELKHYGILGMKWGVRRFQNKDGSLTPAGRKRLTKRFLRYSNSHPIRGGLKSKIAAKRLSKDTQVQESKQKIKNAYSEYNKACNDYDKAVDDYKTNPKHAELRKQNAISFYENEKEQAKNMLRWATDTFPDNLNYINYNKRRVEHYSSKLKKVKSKNYKLDEIDISNALHYHLFNDQSNPVMDLKMDIDSKFKSYEDVIDKESKKLIRRMDTETLDKAINTGEKISKSLRKEKINANVHVSLEELSYEEYIKEKKI